MGHRKLTLGGVVRYEQCPRKYEWCDVERQPQRDTFARRQGLLLHEVGEWLQRRFQSFQSFQSTLPPGGRRRSTVGRGFHPAPPDTSVHDYACPEHSRRDGQECPSYGRFGPGLSRMMAEFWRRWRAAEACGPLPAPSSKAQATRQRNDLSNIPAVLGMLRDHLLQGVIIGVGERFGQGLWPGCGAGLRVTECTVLCGSIDRIVERDGALVIEDLRAGRRRPDALTLSFDLHLNMWALAAEQFIGEPDVLAVYDLRRGEVVQVQYDRGLALHLLDELVAPVATMIEHQQFPKTPHSGWGCRWCDYLDLCWLQESVGRAALPVIPSAIVSTRQAAVVRR